MIPIEDESSPRLSSSPAPPSGTRGGIAQDRGSQCHHLPQAHDRGRRGSARRRVRRPAASIMGVPGNREHQGTAGTKFDHPSLAPSALFSGTAAAGFFLHHWSVPFTLGSSASTRCLPRQCFVPLLCLRLTAMLR